MNRGSTVKSKKAWMIHYSGDDYWHSLPHSRHHITEQLNKHFAVLWVNPIGSHMPSLKKKGLGGRMSRKLRSITKFLQEVKDDFYVITYIKIPYFREGRIQLVNDLLIKWQTKLVCAWLKIDNPLLLYSTPGFANTLGTIKNCFSVYYYSDQYTEYRAFNAETKAYTEALDRKLYENVDLVMCASQKIQDNVAAKTKTKVVYFPHQVDYNFFHNNSDAIPQDIKDIKKPIVGYYGSLSDSNEWDVIRYCVINRPQYNFVFIGRKAIKDTGLENSSNVYFLGKKPFQDIPSYGRAFDVGIMFWVRSEWIINCSPLKLREYLAIGVPVVSTFIEEVKQNFANIVYNASDKETFLEYLDKAIMNKDAERIQMGFEKVKNDNWYNAVKIIIYEMDQKKSLRNS
jgi:hypothetical protein